MLSLVLAAAKFQSELDGLGFPNCVIGGLALQAWGQVRTTNDVDFTILTNFEDEPKKIDLILELVTPRIPNARTFAAVNRVVLGVLEGGVAVDIGLGGFEYERQLVERAVRFEIAQDIVLRIACPEDLVILKVFAGRDQDWIDVEGILVRQAGKLDWQLIQSGLDPLLELVEDPERLGRLHQIRDGN